MKKIVGILLGFMPVLLFAQTWRDNFYLPSNGKSDITFYDIQKEFKEYWNKYDVKKGYYLIDGKKKKAAGWKQFKRWEWFWETRVDPKTGKFPETNNLLINNLKLSSIKADEANWQSLGPNSSQGGYAGIGRINCIAFHPSNTNIFWVGSPSGGLWETTDGGSTWSVLTNNIPVLGVSEIFIPSDYETSKTIYIATGDRDAGDNYSIGVLKSTNDGQTWETTGLVFNQSSRIRITRMLAHPTKQNIIYVATNGGIYKTINSGTNWTKVLNGLFYDMEFKYGGEDSVLFAASRYYTSSGTEYPAVIYKTKDAGATWTPKHTFSNTVLRVELDAAKSNPSIIYALSTNSEGGMDGLYKSANNGLSFTRVYDGTVSGKNLLNYEEGDVSTDGQGWYDLTLAVSPTNENEIYLGGINTWKSTNGGVNWIIKSNWRGANGVPEVHADKHYMEFQDGSTFFEANDGGIYKTTNGGTSWIDLSNELVTSQIYKLGVSQTVKGEVITGLQDNGSKLIYMGNTWYDVKGGDGMECIIDYDDVNTQYATYIEGQIDRTTDRWSSYENIVDISANIPGGPAGAWVTPYLIDPSNHQTIYVGYEDVWKSTNKGNENTWTKISTLSLTNKIRSMAIAPSDNRIIYITDQNYLYKTTNGGASWTDITSYKPTTNNLITSITIDSQNPSKVWITYGGFDAYRVYESNNGGSNWTDISAGLPSVPASTIIQNKLSTTQHLYIGTDIGVYIKKGVYNWVLFSNNLPSVIVTELEIFYDKTNAANSVLYASTYGRGLWKSNLASFTTGINSNDLLEYGIKIYPNPSSGIVNIKLDKTYNDVDIKIVDLTGRIVKRELVKGEGEKIIDLTNLAKGIYLTKMNFNGKDLVSKLIIE